MDVRSLTKCSSLTHTKTAFKHTLNIKKHFYDENTFK